PPANFRCPFGTKPFSRFTQLPMDVNSRKVPPMGKQLSKENGNSINFSQLPSLPKGWAWSIPADFCSVVASGSTPTADKMFEGEGDVPFIKVYNLTHSGVLD